MNHFQVKGSGRTPYRSLRGKDYTGEVVPFGEVCLGRTHSEDGAKLNMRWMRGVFVGKLDRTDELLQLTPTGAMKTHCVRRLEGDNAWDLQILNLAVRGMRQQGARTRDQQPNKRMSWQTANVRKGCTCDRTFCVGTDVLQAGCELELRTMLNLDAFQLMEEMPAGKHAYDMVWVDGWRGDRVRSRLCVRQFRAGELRDVLLQVYVGQSCELQ